MVKSGEEASFDVGTEVPTITSQATSGIQTDGNTGIIQNVQYRKTGILLNIKPVVYSDDRVDLELRQEVSEAQPARFKLASGLFEHLSVSRAPHPARSSEVSAHRRQSSWVRPRPRLYRGE